MRLVRAPLRVSFGGTDCYGGAVVSATIDKYVYVAVHSRLEGHGLTCPFAVESGEVRHPIVREALCDAPPTEVLSTADLPGRSGLGSSSAFAVALLTALNPGWPIRRVADEACELEPSHGRQDQFASAYGGVNLLQFDYNVTITPHTLPLPSMLLFYTGWVRERSKVQYGDKDREMLSSIALRMHSAGVSGELMAEAWEVKRRVVRDDAADTVMRCALAAGATGGRLLGAGGGGYMLFVAKDKERLVAALKELRHIPVTFGVPGVEVLHDG